MEIASFFVELACGEQDIVVTISVQCTVRICPSRNFYIYAWILKNNLAQLFSLRSRSAI